MSTKRVLANVRGSGPLPSPRKKVKVLKNAPSLISTQSKSQESDDWIQFRFDASPNSDKDNNCDQDPSFEDEEIVVPARTRSKHLPIVPSSDSDAEDLVDRQYGNLVINDDDDDDDDEDEDYNHEEEISSAGAFNSLGFELTASGNPSTKALTSDPTLNSQSKSLLSGILEKQKVILEARGALVSPHALRKRKKERADVALLRRAANAQSIEERWTVYLHTLDNAFFTSSEARLQELSRVRKGTVAYQGLLVTDENCEDMKTMYRLGWQAKVNLGQSAGTYDQFRVVVGQYSRFAVAVSLCQAEEICEKGSLFDIVLSMDALQAFIGYFQIRSAAGTVMGKALHLIRLAHFASSYFATEGREKDKGRLVAIVEYLRGVARAHKTESRRQASIRKNADERAMAGKILTPQDFRKFLSVAKEACKSMRAKAEEWIATNGSEKFGSFVASRKGFLNKWSLNVLCYLMLSGGGQRPQVYTLLEAPSELDFPELGRQCRTDSVFSLKLSNEKRTRSVDLPNVLFPSAVFRSLKFHVTHIMPCLYSLFKVPEGDTRRKYLLLSTRGGQVLSSLSITSSFRRFLREIDPEAGNIDSMSLRASFATLMVKKHKAGKLLAHMSQDQFLVYLAKLMNTSEEQLKQTYVASDHQDFATCAVMVTEALRNEYSDSESE